MLSTEAFDAGPVSPTTVRFGPAEAGIAHAHAHLEDVNGDGLTDLVTHFRTQETGLERGMTEATLTGQTFDGDAIAGSDSVRIVGCKGNGQEVVVDSGGVGRN